MNKKRNSCQLEKTSKQLAKKNNSICQECYDSYIVSYEAIKPFLTVGMPYSDWAERFIEKHNKETEEYDALSEEEKDKVDGIDKKKSKYPSHTRAWAKKCNNPKNSLNKKPPQINSQFQFKLKIASKKDQNKQNQQKFPFFTIIPATEKAKDYILKLKKQNEDLQDIILRLESENQDLKQRLGKYEIVE